ncbi:hypothetical protein HYPSUDRAFT_166731 [Hypholoma sublateritium FD-334 SS-4]|uniref:Uncharacterized protein n=1 Tax=Hypholoma sublateritium (strain FD-334 SS-4) TaxID=945553 RepID=A0A0D2NWD6_HYPSF|nr:hypothetical protein HYPSUDRAFT_166731 [Hypholoma sublateritium FD-334 SS-4]
MSDLLSNFNCLDELTQVIYQGICKFVVVSAVSDDAWNVHVGLSGQQGRWWRGSWTEEDVRLHFEPELSDDHLESCAEKLVECFIQGNVCISDWSAEKDAVIKFTLGPTSAKPTHVPLTEMSAVEAAAYATQVLTDIALQAQSRKCRLYPSTLDYPAEAPVLKSDQSIPLKQREKSPDTTAAFKTKERSTNESGSSHRMHAGRAPKPLASMPALKAGQPDLKASTSRSTSKNSVTPLPHKPVAALARRAKGASLANPNKRARKYQAIEFESDAE